VIKILTSVILGITVLIFPVTSFAAPFDLKWGIKELSIPEVKNFRYWYGDATWGSIIYNGTKDLDGLETELHLEYSAARFLQEAILILGPGGISKGNCISTYKRVINALNKKYGHFIYQKEIKDPLAYDLVFNGYCNQVESGLHETSTFWKTPRFKIELWLYGDEETIFIEVGYYYLSQGKKRDFLSEVF
jgi:hypothetical protein